FPLLLTYVFPYGNNAVRQLLKSQYFMKRLVPLCLVMLFSCVKQEPEIQTEQPPLQSAQLQTATLLTIKNKPAHIFVVWFENKGYTQIIGSSNAPYINSLVSKGTLFTAAYANYHPSYPNYITWFAGSSYGVTNDACIDKTPFTAGTLYSSLAKAGRSFVWYSEGLPQAGSTICKSGYYVEKHNPVTLFKNIPIAANQPLTALHLTDTSTFKNLPRVVSVTPNMINDMHDGTIRQGDDWLKAKFGKLINWCLTNNSIFIVYFDEDNGSQDNRIPVVAVGQYVKANYKLTAKVNHHSFSKFILVANNADTTFQSNIRNAKIITNIWK
ncbi:MAG TPA: alkaline phosphatase family protein, partial [Chitinophagaceae bacterium]|nr:alkaline phosphatase family protein [Chitinophagaceae bacterium]